ncbi:EscU/YscU/HrcU family type III secretion system export apparatus switch protein [Candidatus Sulfurimonas baltica]|uniref:EscU/YscU/HrcU family type III secretion system export apparatus switch protein n=1 Tax=Candidatus Sulfurimonas baltica TaxID=2740404 RepID=A0A7S7LV85_9BACT|nr:EscU/YscU/HrcU family type III secretion system export apparatus switch protein [Candidatus Sulfurimonas baltica]QOY51907.1 EscU/YscU/HrcU family type III secretion system export apparatus switch protein [Candidatus Sulfurimonas baltica]
MQDKAAALEYDKKSGSAPKVTASGKGTIAQSIIAKAKEFDVPIFANEALVNSLVDLEIDKEIPSELYQAIADVFIWLMKNEKSFKLGK